MNQQKSTRRRRRFRSSAEQMYWDGLTPSEQLAFTIGYACGQGAPFPPPQHIEALRVQLGLAKPPRTSESSPSPKKRRRRSAGYDLALVAATARAAIARGDSAALAVMAVCGCPTRTAASSQITKARKLGYHIPHVNAGVAEYQRTRARGDVS